MTHHRRKYYLIAVLLLGALMGCASQSAQMNKRALRPPEPLSPGAAGLVADETDTTLTAAEKALFEEDEVDAGEPVLIADPFEPFNRAMFTFNIKLYDWILRPVTLGYRKAAPQSVRIGVSNFFTNLATPSVLATVFCRAKGRRRRSKFSN